MMYSRRSNGSDGDKAKAATTIQRRRNSLFLLSSRLLAVRGGNEAGMSMATVTTLGDLEPRGEPNHQKNGDESSFWYPRSAFDENGGGMRRGNEGYDEGGENTEILPAAARMGGRNGGTATRIHLDLSGRVVCHLISRRKQSSSGSGVATEGGTSPSSVPLLSLAEPARAMSKPMENGKQKQKQQCNINAPPSFVKSIATRYIDDVTTFVTRRRRLDLLPHDIYIGANYNFDEIWYGATRIITKCSWGPYYDVRQRQSGGNDGSQLIVIPSWSSSSLANKSSWTINVEKEMNVFDRYDTTSRIRCVQQYPSPSSSSSVMSPHTTAASRSRQITLEYDSAKLNTNIDNIDNGNDRSTITMTAGRKRIRSNNNKRRSNNNGQYLAPTMSMHVKTPLFHPRLAAHVKKTWIVNTNKYNNNYVVDSANGGDSVNRRYSSILERYSNSIPKSIIVHTSILPVTTTTSGAATTRGGAAAAAAASSACRGYKKKLSKWLENDGWLPTTKMTVDLLGNIITKNEIGFKAPTSTPPPTTTPLTTKKCQSSTTTIPSWHIIHDMGIRLSLSKKVDWSTMGIIFPWSSSNNGGSSRHNNVGSGGSSGMFGMLQSTHARLELCGMYDGASSLPRQQQHGIATGRMSSIGVDVEPLDWSSTFRVTVCHEDVSFL